MKKDMFILLTLLVAVITGLGHTNDAAFFRMASPSYVVLTELDPFAGTLSWSNGTAGVTNQLQRSVNLSDTNGWVDYVMLVSTGAAACTERIIDLDPPEGMVLVPSGINCGTNPLGDGESYDALYFPSNYTLSVSAFFMDKYEVTKTLWDEVQNWATNNSYSFDNVGSGKAPDHPVHTVNWYDCVKWCNARSEMEGRIPCYTVSNNVYRTGQSAPDCAFDVGGYRLPTSDEWEYAARGGLKSQRFPWGDTITHSNANYNSSMYISYDISPTRKYHPDYWYQPIPYTSPVGSFAANGYGLHDMSGNVWEWCWDSFPQYELYIPHVQRGGDFGGLPSADDCRVGTRSWGGAATAVYTVGFRSVLPAH